uniref:WhiB family transcriptional regulator n=1 Tax=Streptomyces scabiei TaxID=1930 RepID=UPI000E691B68|nr:WhiB family transcriptional regulator [Streptomyces scabiei]
MPTLAAWHERAACAGQDTELWFPKQPIDSPAMNTCRACPSRAECLYDALRFETHGSPRYGIRGGLTTGQRRNLPPLEGPKAVTIAALRTLLDEIDTQGGPEAARQNRLDLDPLTERTPPMTTAPAPETARQLLWRHGLPEDVLDGALALHAQELAGKIRAHRDHARGAVQATKVMDFAADLISPEHWANEQPAAAPQGGLPCGNNPNFRLSPGDRQAVDDFKAYLAQRAADLLALATVLEIPRPEPALPVQLRRAHGHTNRWAICDGVVGRRWHREHGWVYEQQGIREEAQRDATRYTLAEAVPLARKLAMRVQP